MNKEQIIAFLRVHKDEYAQRYSVRRIGLFGSHVRDEAVGESDIDIIVDMDHPTFDAYMDLKFSLERALGAQVDLVLFGTVKPRLWPIIAREVVYA